VPRVGPVLGRQLALEAVVGHAELALVVAAQEDHAPRGEHLGA